MDAKDERAIDCLIVWCGLEAYPAERQRKGDGRSDQAAPGEKPVRGLTCLGAALDEALQHDVVPENDGQSGDVARQSSWLQENLPAAKPVETGWRTAQPHGVPVAQTERREHGGSGIGNQGGIKVFETTAADHDADDQQDSGDQPPGKGMRRVRTAW